MAGSLQLVLNDEMNFKNGWTATQHKYAPSRVSPESEPTSDTLSPEELNEETSLIFEQNSATTSQSPADQQSDSLSSPSAGAPTILPSLSELNLIPSLPNLPAFAEPRLPAFPEPRTVPSFADLAISIRDEPPPLVHLSHLNDATASDRVLPAIADPSPLTSGSAPRPSLRVYPPGASVHPSRELPILLKDLYQRPSDVLPQRPFENQDLNDAAKLGVQAMNEGRYMPTTPVRRVFRLEDESFVQLCQRAKSETSMSVEESLLEGAH